MRSLNGQIEFLLRRSLAGAGRLSTSVSAPPSGVPAQGRPKPAVAPPAARSVERRPEARPESTTSADWDAMED
jgi:hypothetical protein